MIKKKKRKYFLNHFIKHYWNVLPHDSVIMNIKVILEVTEIRVCLVLVVNHKIDF
jgi:hypothetical protein